VKTAGEGIPRHTWHGVPPYGGGAHANMMILKTFNAPGQAATLPAEAGAPNPGVARPNSCK